MSKEFAEWMAEFMKTDEWASDSFRWDDMAKSAFEAGQAAACAKGYAECAEDYKEVIASHNQLVRDLDVLMNGIEGAAPVNTGTPEIAVALRDMLALWERVHGTAIIGRPTVNAAKRALKCAA